MMIKIEALENGAHENQSVTLSPLPEGWAVVPEAVPRPDTFPFVELDVEEVDGVMTVTAMRPGAVPEPPEEAPPQPTQLDRIQAQVLYTAVLTDTLMEG